MKATWIALLLVFGLVNVSEGSSNLAGDWKGTISAGGVELGLILHFSEAGDGWKATLDVPAQGAIGLAVDEVTVVDGELKLKLNRLTASYQGVLNASRTMAIGKWKQSGASLDLILTKTAKAETLVIPKELRGTWEGKLSDSGFGLRIGLRLETRPDGVSLAGFSSPDQGQKFLPINAMSFDGKTFKAESQMIKATYTGEVNADRTEIVGTWNQGDRKFPLTLKRTAKLSEPNRPQTPKPPYPYESIDVTYPNDAAKITLAGTLTLPKGTGPFPVAIMITGSGPQDRDETLFGHKPFLVIADALTKRGIAVLRVDDRGVGKSTGSQADATSVDFAGDVRAGIAFLKTRKEIDPKAIGLIGHSEGGLIGPIVAAQTKDVAFIVMLAGTGVKGSEILKFQNRQAVAPLKLSEAYLKFQDETLDAIYNAVTSESDPKAAVNKLRAQIKVPSTLTGNELKAVQGYTGKALDAVVAQLSQPWFRYFVGYDPTTSLAKVTCPVLALNGALDMQVPAQTNLKAISQALTAAGNTKFKIVERPGLNHLFQSCKTGAPSEYASIEQTFDPETLTIMADWIISTTGKR